MMKVKDIIDGNALWHPAKGGGNTQPTVSVLLPTFRRGKSGLFRNAVESVIRQSMTSFELIIIDDASTDGTYDQIMDFMEKDNRISCIRHTDNVGLPAISEYEGFMKSRGEYIAFMFDDVEWEPRALEMMLDGMLKADLKCAFGRMLLRNDPGDYSRGIPLGGSYALYVLQNLDSHNFIANASVLLHREVIECVGLYDPHVSMVRICDWDLLRRIIKDFHLEALDMFVGYENGYITKDSIGRTMKLDSWVVSERIKLDRKSALKPMNFHEIDVLEIHGTTTQYFKSVVSEISNQYSTKSWYIKTQNGVEKARKTIPILVVSPDSIDASTTLCFGRKSYSGANLRIVCANIWQLDQLSGAACVIMVRSLTVASIWKEYAKKLGIPIYYFVDDNLPSVSKYIKDYKDYTIENVRTWLMDYDGVLASSKELAKYYTKRNIHEKTYCFPPVIGSLLYENKTKFSDKEAIFSIAFIGSSFRNESLIHCVWPAIGELAAYTKIKFCCPDDSALRSLGDSSSNISVTYVPRTMSLDQMLLKYNNLNVDAIVHPGPDIENNRYKTLNLLLNAVQLGAVLVVPDRPPFNQVEDRERLFVSIKDDSPQGWCNGLKRVLDKEIRREMVKKSTEFCLSQYAGEQNQLVIDEITKDLDEIGYLTKTQRLNEIYNFDVPAVPPDADEVSCIDADIKSLPEFHMKPSPILRRFFQFRYQIVPDIDWFESVAICIGTHGNQLNGDLVLRIFTGKNSQIPLRISRAPLLDVGDKDWVNFETEPIRDCLGQELTFSFSMEKSSPLSFLSIYEADDNHSENWGILRGLLNRFKIDRQGLVFRLF